MSNNEASYEVYWPRGERTLDVQAIAPRLESLSGKTIAFLWDYMFRGDEIFAILQKQLQGRFPGMRFIGQDEFGSTHGEDERKVLAELPQKLKLLKVDAVISGMGC